MSEILHGIKLIKMWAWEALFSKGVEDVRSQEMKYINRSYIFRMMKLALHNIMLKLIVFLTLVIFVVVYQNPVTMETVGIKLAKSYTFRTKL